ncbi:hypothetical protein [Glutamicibacter sp. NPDC087344]|uniref:hypothetical protein n=1 Tax=Glutamicibacter sp. NPDC087344 TaxID=3363994 RepID=UPI0038249C0A
MSDTAAANRLSSMKKMMIGSAALVFIVGATGCSAVEDFNKSTSDSWAVTYEVSVAGGDTSKITDVRYLESEKRGEAGTELSLASGQTTADGQGKAVWSLESIVTAEKDASISAVPGKGATATCRILLDGVKEIAVETSAPGERVQCAANTPAFSK